MFEEAGRACLNAHLSNVFKDWTVYLRYITMPSIQKERQLVRPNEPGVVLKRMIVKHLDTVDKDSSETHAGIILQDGKEGVVNWLFRT